MAYDALARPRSRHPLAVALVAGLHGVIGYALVDSMAHRTVERSHAPVEARIVEEPKRRTPPPPPPQVMAVALELPPPAYVPPPEVRIARPPPVPVIATTSITPPKSPVLMPAPPPSTSASKLPQVAVARVPSPPRLARPARIRVAGCDRPAYPRAALRAGATGTTRIEFAVDASGRVMRAWIVNSSGASRAHRQMDRAAMAALARCTFEPGIDERGRSVGASATVEYVWNIDD
jgi:periplasmic protein TonB